MNENKDFNMEKAHELLKLYQSKKETDKQKFLTELIKRQEYFKEKSITSCPQLLANYYCRTTITVVIADLGYDLIYPKDSDVGVYNRFNFITFN